MTKLGNQYKYFKKTLYTTAVNACNMWQLFQQNLHHVRGVKIVCNQFSWKKKTKMNNSETYSGNYPSMPACVCVSVYVCMCLCVCVCVCVCVRESESDL